MNQLTGVMLIALVLSTGCSQDKGSGQTNTIPSVTPGFEPARPIRVHDKSMASKSGEEILYTISIPPNYDPQTPTLLVVVLHFGGEVTPHYAREILEMLMITGLSDLNVILVAPDSIAGPWTNQKNENMVLELMDNVCETYNIDRNRTLLTGFSMGGHGTWYIGSRNQDRFSALIPIAGSPGVEDDVTWTTPVYAIHSKADTVVPIQATKEYVAAQKELGNQNIELAVIENVPHFQTSGFSTALRNAAPWVLEIWDAEGNRESKSGN